MGLKPAIIPNTAETMTRLIELNAEACTTLLRLCGVGERPAQYLPVRLIHPTLRGGERRVSEQEARFVYAATVERRRDFCYSVETPTTETYSFSSGGRRSAQSDLSLYSLGPFGFQKEANVEFKQNRAGLDKDLEKLVREGLPGHWFHFPARTGEQSLWKLKENLRRSLTTVLSDGHTMRAPILFTLALASEGVAFWEILDVEGSASQPDAVNRFFAPGRVWQRIQVRVPPPSPPSAR